VFDVLLFGRLKSVESIDRGMRIKDSQIDHNLCVFRIDEIAATSSTMRGSSEKTGFGFAKRENTYYL
jgi:hypothetical protein